MLRSFSFSYIIYFYCAIFPLFPLFIGPVCVCLNHLPAFIFHFSSLPLSRSSLAVIILTIHISCSRMGLKEALIKAKTCSRKISIRHQLQGPVDSTGSALTLSFSPGSVPKVPGNLRLSWHWHSKAQLPWRGWSVSLEALSSGSRQQGFGMGQVFTSFCSLQVPLLSESWRHGGMAWWHSFTHSLSAGITAFTTFLQHKAGHLSGSSHPRPLPCHQPCLMARASFISFPFCLRYGCKESILVSIWADPLFFFSS